MGRGRRSAAREIALSNGDGRRRLAPPQAASLPSLGLRVAVEGLGDGYPSFAGGGAPELRLRDDEQVVLVYGQEGRTLVGNLGTDATKGALLARLLREGNRLKAEVLVQQGGWGRGPLNLELIVEVC